MAFVITFSPARKVPEMTCVTLPSLTPTMTSRGSGVSPSSTHTRPGRGSDDNVTVDQDAAGDVGDPKEGAGVDVVEADVLGRTGAV